MSPSAPVHRPGPPLDGGPGPAVLLSEAAFVRFEQQLRDAAADARWLIMATDGRLHAVPVGRPCAAGPLTLDAVDVGWTTADLFDANRAVAAFNDHLRQAPGLRWFQSAAAGTEHAIYGELMDRGVRVTTNHSSTVPIAEFVMRAVLDCLQEAWRWRESAAEHAWRRHDFREVRGTTWLIVGTGHIGSAVARLAGAFGAHVIGARRTPGNSGGVDEMIAADEVVSTVPRADVVVIAAPATPHTRHFVGAELLAAMGRGSILVNVARGELVDEAALLEALDRGAPEWAVLDVLQREPLPPADPLWSHPRVLITPHSAGMGSGRYARGTELFIENLRRWRSGAPLLNELADSTWAVRVAPEGAG